MHQDPKRIPPALPFQEAFFESLLKLIKEGIDRKTPYGDINARDYARFAGNSARCWHPEIRGEDEPPPEWYTNKILRQVVEVRYAHGF